ncbi:hypothetical protein [uncultured Thiodictyon sp.]|uniref:hypothetical protein n=1 Tax=uncultured Thiodictyon sp. TaxID=1846217 RepID=UPI0025D74908|nr:hypothetical protein [uncultured Thiodictyon sp.]
MAPRAQSFGSRPGRPANLPELARRVVRAHGPALLKTLEQAALLGDVQAVTALIDLANQGKAPPPSAQ